MDERGRPGPEVPPTSARVVALGTGSAVGLPPRGHASLLLELGGEPLLVDAPGDVAGRLLAAGTDPLDLRTMVLTHHHEDHWHGLPALLLHRMVRRRFGVRLPDGVEPGSPGPPLRILAPPETIAFLERLLELLGRAELVQLEAFAEGDPPRPVGTAGWTLQPVAGDHGSMPMVGFVARPPAGGPEGDGPGGPGGPVIAYSSDSEPTDAFLRAAAGADLMIHECQEATLAPPGHASADTLAAAIGRLAGDGVAPPRVIAAMHILPWPPEEAERIRRVLERDLPPSVRVLVPDDGAELLRHGLPG